MNLWIVGKINDDDYLRWEFQGVFDSEERAIVACKTDMFFVGPATLNDELPSESKVWDKAFYPRAKNE